METLKKAGMMTQHLALFNHLQNLRSLLQLAQIMEEGKQRAVLITQKTFRLFDQPQEVEQLSTSKGQNISAATVFGLLKNLKGFESEEYAVTREELAALNTRAVQSVEASDDLRAFEATLERIKATPEINSASTEAAEDKPKEKTSRQKETSEQGSN